MNSALPQRFDGLGTSTLSDAMERLGLARTVIVGFRMLAAAGTLMVGPAFTVRQAPKRDPGSKSIRRVKHSDVAENLVEAGQVIVVDVAGRLDIASWGDNLSRSAKAREAAGVLINGCTRDSASVLAAGVPVFCLGFSPIKSQWDLETVGLNEPVTIGSVQIRAGDIVAGDQDGLIVIAPESLDDVLGKAHEIRAAERARYG